MRLRALLFLTAAFAASAQAAEVAVKERLTLSGRGGKLSGLAFSPDGRSLVSAAGGESGSEVRLWDLDGGRQKQAIAAPASLFLVALAADPKAAILSPLPGVGGLRYWDMATGTQRALDVGLHRGEVRALLSPEGYRLLWDSEDRGLSLFDMRRLAAARLESSCAATEAFAFSPDGLIVVAACRDGSLRVWDAVTGALAAQAPSGGRMHALVFSPAGTQLVFLRDGGSRMELALWDFSARKEEWKSDAGAVAAANAVAFSPDGRLLAHSDAEGAVLFTDARTGRRAGKADGWTQAGRPVVIERLVFSPEGDALAAGGRDSVGPMKISAVAPPAAAPPAARKTQRASGRPPAKLSLRVVLPPPLWGRAGVGGEGKPPVSLSRVSGEGGGEGKFVVAALAALVIVALVLAVKVLRQNKTAG
ncbi:MAG: WD40 repeat domain-containing protein [Elusimicrobia bacterium]|nr:WD40 repeat domain-containing protein [Elusimicrobiota bacterium]